MLQWVPSICWGPSLLMVFSNKTFDYFRLARDIELMTGSKPSMYWMICWKYLSPLAMTAILVASFVQMALNGAGYDAWISDLGKTVVKPWPWWANILIFLLIGMSALWIPFVAILRQVTLYIRVYYSSLIFDRILEKLPNNLDLKFWYLMSCLKYIDLSYDRDLGFVDSRCGDTQASFSRVYQSGLIFDRILESGDTQAR